jgi:hypothetical protein
MTIPPPELRPEDFTRTYDLPDTLTAGIPTCAQPGEPGSHWVARGLMAECCALLLARPLNLDHIEHPHTLFITATISLASTVLSSDPVGHVACVDLVVIEHSHQWALILDNRLLAVGRHLPSPHHLASLVQAAYLAGRSAEPDTCRGPVPRPRHLW